jgi:polyvinyl alcohol dehydrogenase (cytochrome)
MVAVDAATGKILWRTYTITEEAHELEKNSAGTQLWGPSGVPIWNSPAIDIRRNVIYSGTGNNYLFRRQTCPTLLSLSICLPGRSAGEPSY